MEHNIYNDESNKKDIIINSLIDPNNNKEFSVSNETPKNPCSLVSETKNEFNSTNKPSAKEITNNIFPKVNIPENNYQFNQYEIDDRTKNYYIPSTYLFSQNITKRNNNSNSNSNSNIYGPKKNEERIIGSIVSNTISGVAFAGSFLNRLSYKNKPKNETSNQSSISKIESGQKLSAFGPIGLLKQLKKKVPNEKHNKFDYYKDKIQKGLTNKNILTAVSVGIDIFSAYQEIKEAVKDSKKNYEEDLKNIDKSNINQLSRLEKKELEEKENKKADEEYQEKKLMKKGTEEWNRYKKELIESILRDIDYMNLIEEIFENYFLDFKADINEKILEIFNNDFKVKFALLIQEKHHSIFLAIKNSIPQIETLNLIITGFSGVGKSCLTNVLLKFNEAKEGNGIYSVSQTFKKYSNPKIPGMTIYDTIGIEPTNKERNIEKIKEKIQETFDKNLEDSQNSIHSVLYCIKNGNSSKRIESGQIQLIHELNRRYGNNDILTVVLTQTINNETEKRINQLQEDLNNKNIEIIDILAKDYTIKRGNQRITVNAFGLDKLISSIKRNAKKVVIANLKQIAKIKIKKEYIENTNKKYNEIRAKIRNHELESTFIKECELILKILFGNLNLKFDDIEKVISRYIEKLNINIINEIKNKNKEKSLDKINEEFIIFNAKYDNLLKQNSNDYEDYIFNEKFENYFIPKIKEEVNKIILENASLIFMENIRNFFSDIISDNVKDEEIEDLAASNVDKILKKLNN